MRKTSDNAVPFLASALLMACVTLAPAGPEENRIEIRVAQEPDAQFDLTRAALVRAGFTVSTAERDGGVIVTAPIRHPPREVWITVNIVSDGDDGALIVLTGRGRYQGAVRSALDGEYALTSRTLHWDDVVRAADAIRGSIADERGAADEPFHDFQEPAGRTRPTATSRLSALRPG